MTAQCRRFILNDQPQNEVARTYAVFPKKTLLQLSPPMNTPHSTSTQRIVTQLTLRVTRTVDCMEAKASRFMRKRAIHR